MGKITTSFLFICLFILTGCNQKINNSEQPAVKENADVSNQKKEIKQSNNDLSGSQIAQSQNEQNNKIQQIIYNNSEYGFNLTFPQIWKGYLVKKRTIDWGDAGTSDSLDFGFLEQDSLFNIGIHTKEQWEKIQSDEGPVPTYIGEKDRYVFAYSTAQDAANNIIIKRMEEIPSIIQTFRLNK